ncbi:dipeptidase PepE [Rubricoccus marinus]|uniref:dipeptidase E n=1 Tax=Rubricoccus marinus TaxID=716817 RepID=A0A259U231_9BACT|nr:dipeptidase PepE [Rubricoccus marinus]OZC03898.1 dipeptidase E [Rubricoccus marinus]
MNLLLLSNSSSDAGYLTHALPWLRETLDGVKRAAFIPYAGVTVSWDDYAAKVREALDGLGIEIVSVHETANPTGLVGEADAVLVGGGNTFQLLKETYRVGLVELVRQRVQDGMPYVGWSAGSNLACPTIKTTNDMPVAQPPTFEAFGLVPFQINPHFTDAHPPGHRGETRRQRLAEFVVANPEMPVVGLPEGTALRVASGEMHILGAEHALVFDPTSPEGREISAEEIAALAV